MTGPGVYDMKGGLVQMLFALKALKALDEAQQGPRYANVSNDDGRLLRLLTETTSAQLVVEIGTSADLVVGDDINIFGEGVYQFSFTFISPLGTYYCSDGHINYSEFLSLILILNGKIAG